MVFSRFSGSKTKALERRFTTFSEQLASIFQRIKSDITDTNYKVSSAEKDLNNLKLWVAHLNRQNMLLEDQNKDLSEKVNDLGQKSSQLYTSHAELLAHHLDTQKTLNTHREALKSQNSHNTEVSTLILDYSKGLKEALEGHKNLTFDEIERLKGWIDYFQKEVDERKEREKALEAEILALRNSVPESSQDPSEHIESLRGANMALQGKVESMSQSIESLRSALENAQSELQDTQSEVKNTQNSMHFIQKKVESETSELKKQFQTSQIAPQSPQPIIQEVSPAPQQGFERHIMSRVMPNRKGYILKFIVDLASENRFSTKEIEEIVVKEKRLCGRTSFYAYLKELKYRGKLGYANIDERAVLVNLEQRAEQ